MTPLIVLAIALALLYLASTNKLYAVMQIFLTDTRKVSSATNKR